MSDEGYFHRWCAEWLPRWVRLNSLHPCPWKDGRAESIRLGDTHPRTPIVGRVPVDWRGTDAAVCDRSVSAICYEMVGWDDRIGYRCLSAARPAPHSIRSLCVTYWQRYRQSVPCHSMLLTPSLHGAVYMAMSIITTQLDGKQGLEKGIFCVRVDECG